MEECLAVLPSEHSCLCCLLCCVSKMFLVWLYQQFKLLPGVAALAVILTVLGTCSYRIISFKAKNYKSE